MCVDLQTKFKAATEHVRKLPSSPEVTNDIKLKFYALFKQATVGPCKVHGGSQPYKVQFESRAKWDAWNELGEKSQEDAMKDYIDQLTRMTPNWATAL